MKYEERLNYPYSITCFCGEKLDISITTTGKYTVTKKKEKQ